MPNMFGGDQFHPAYDPRSEVGPKQIMLGNRLYTAVSDETAEWEDVDGSRGSGPIPPELRAKLDRN